MSFHEIYTPTQEARVSSTINTLRKMRSAGESAVAHYEDPQVILRDAEILAKAPAPYLIHLLEQAQAPEMLQRWEHTLKDMETKYEKFKPIKRSPISTSLMDVETHLKTLYTHKPSFITTIYISMNNLGAIKFEDMFDEDFGILAPLSTDVFTASLLPEYIKTHCSDRIPTVKPALVFPDLSHVILPRNNEGLPVFSYFSSILAFVDLDALGNTRNTLHRAAEKEYPGKVIETGLPYKQVAKVNKNLI